MSKSTHVSSNRSSARRKLSKRGGRAGVAPHLFESLEKRALLAAVSAISPNSFGLGVAVNSSVKVTFGSAMDKNTITNSTFELLDSSNTIIGGRISYNASNNTATFDATAPLQYGQTYHTLVKSGAGGVIDSNGGVLANDVSWSFTTAAAPTTGTGGPILVVTSTSNPFSSYYPEILRAEGMNSFGTADISTVNATLLNNYNVVILSEMALTAAQVTALTTWVTNGGNLIAMKPDKQLASLLGLTATANTTANTYIKINTSSGPGAGITADTMQYHGSADVYNLNGATSIASLYSSASTGTSNPAVTVRTVGSNGGQAAAFTYDLAKSIIYTRQGNPAWAGQERDGQAPIRSDDLFFGNSATDPQPDWVDMSKVQIPQADEQQRLLANMIESMNLDVMPLPRFWYLPNGNKAAVIMTGDDHNYGGDGAGTPGRWNQYLSAGTSGGQPIYGTSYIVQAGTLSDAQAAQFAALGFEAALHVEVEDANGVARNWTSYADLNSLYLNELSKFEFLYPSLATPKTNRTHAIVWSDYDSQPQIEYSYNIRLDTSYYYWPGEWVQDRPGLFTGSGMPMRFAKADGTMIDVYQAPTQITDENNATEPFHINTLLNNALGSLGYYGAFTVNAHTDFANSPLSDAIVAAAKAHNVPIVTSKQMMDWLDGRNGSSFSGMTWNNTAKTLNFSVNAAEGANGLQAMVPVHGAGALRLSGITSGGNAVSFTTQTIKGIQYAFFNASSGAYVAQYANDTVAPTITTKTPASAATNVPVSAKPSVTFNEDMQAGTATFFVRDAANVTVAGNVSFDAATNTATFTPNSLLNPGVVYTVTVSGAKDVAGNAMAGSTTWSFTTLANTSQTIWSPSDTPTVANAPDSAVEVGVKFRSDVSGQITGIRFYKGSQNTGVHVGSLWSSTGTLLGQATFGSESASGWQTVTFTTPITIAANTTYIASYHTNVGNYSADTGYFANSGIDNVYLHALANGVDGGNGVFAYSANSVFPNQTFNSNNFWVDVTFLPQVGDSTLPTVGSQSPAPASIGIATNSVVSAVFSEGVQSATISMVVKDAANNTVAGSVAYDAITLAVTFTPTAALTSNTTYTATISGAKDGAGNTMNPVSWSFTTVVSSDVTPPTVSSLTPASGATNVATSSAISGIFSEVIQSGTISMVLTNPAHASIPGTVTYNSTTRTATFTPSAALSPSTKYNMTISGTKDTAGNTMVPLTWSFTTAGITGTTIWPTNQLPALAAESDFSAIEVGMKFTASVNGTITAIRFYKGAGNSGTHVGHIWSSTGTLLGTANFSGESATGWQQATFTTPVTITAGTTYVASYYAPVGRYAVNENYFASSVSSANGVLTAPSSASSGGNGLYRYGTGGGFPNQTYQMENYWVDVVFSSAINSDTVAPTISSRTPASAATGVATNSTISVVFNEPMQSPTISMVLKNAANVTIAGSVSYNSATNTAVFTPSAPLAGSTTYTMTVSGGLDLSGNAMASTSWSFTTTASADTTPPTVISMSPAAGVTGVAVNSTISAVFSEPVQSGTISMILKDAANNTIAGTVTYNSATNTATFTPTVALAGSTTYTMTISATKDISGNTMVAMNSSFTTAVVDVTAPVISSRSPAAGATGVTISGAITATFNEAVQSGTISMILTDAANNTVAGTVSYNAATLTATFTPTAPLSSSTVYTMTVSGTKDTAGNTMVSTNWSFTTAAAGTTTSIWSGSTVPAVPAASDPTAVELGIKFRSTAAGFITSIRFYKGAGNGGTHIAHLWSSTGTLLATGTFNNESATGWQQVDFTTPVAIAANTTYVASYFAPQGNYAIDAGYFATAGSSNGTLTALANGVDGGNGVFIYGPGGGFPNQTFNSANYWVDVVYSVTGPVDTTAPTVSSRSPVSGATGVATSTTVTATFSEPVQSGTISMILKDAANNTIAGTVTYNSATNTATFTPTVALSLNTTYTMTLSGAKDAANNTMVSTNWSFTTAATNTISVWPNTTVPGTPADSDGTAVELGMKFRSSASGYITALRFYKGAGNGGTHIGHLWSSTGTLLATITFNNESATGWQTANLNTAVAITANTTYIVSYFAPQGHYAVDAGYFASAGVTNGPITALANGVDGGNGVFIYGPSGGFPNQTFNSANYWVDVVYSATPPADITAPTVTNQTPASGATGVATSSTVTATFSEAVQAATISMVLKNASNVTIPGTVSFNSTTNVATFTPTSALALNTTYTITVSGTKDTAGNTMASTSWSFTTTASSAYSVWNDSIVPVIPSSGDTNAVELGMKFRVNANGFVTGVRFYKGAGNGGTHIGHLWDSLGNLLATVTFGTESATGWQTATFSTAVAVTAGVTYIVSYFAPQGNYSANSSFFTAGTTTSAITALASGVDGGNGVFLYGGGFPNQTFNSTNYWVDVLFTTALP